jgi:hypothetical protein
LEGRIKVRHAKSLFTLEQVWKVVEMIFAIAEKKELSSCQERFFHVSPVTFKFGGKREAKKTYFSG